MSIFGFPFGDLFNEPRVKNYGGMMTDEQWDSFFRSFFSKDNPFWDDKYVVKTYRSDASPKNKKIEQEVEQEVKNDTQDDLGKYIRIDPFAYQELTAPSYAFAKPDAIEEKKVTKEEHEVEKPKPTKTILDILGYKRPEKELKNPFVFIANNLTFAIKTKYPIIWDTSTIITDDRSMFVAIDEKKTFPKVDKTEVGKMSCEINRDKDIQNEIDKYLDGTEFTNIYAFPAEEIVYGERRLGIVFYVYKKSNNTHWTHVCTDK